MDPVQRPLREFLDPLVATTMLVALAGTTPVARHLGEWRDRISNAHVPVGTLVLAADALWLFFVLVAATSFLAAGTYNPFIYFRF